jgi:glycosyltransferase involved in cell wall biosynthesis
MDSLYIVIPAYNEEANIEEVIKDWYPVIEKMSDDSRLVVIDDGSKDSTYKIMQRLAGVYKKFIPLINLLKS